MSIIVRAIDVHDEPHWRELWAGYLAFYENSDLDPKITDHTWAMLSGIREDAFGYVAHMDGTMVGIVHCVVHANTWLDMPVCYLEDLFVGVNARGNGAGRALIEAVYDHARTEGWPQVYWRTAESNPARALYDKVADKIDFVTYVKTLS